MSRPALPSRVLRDARWRALALVVMAIAAGGMLIAAVTEGGWLNRFFSTDSTLRNGSVQASDPVKREIHLRFQQGVVMLHAKQYEHAMTAFHRVLELDPAMPEAHVNMGFVLVGLERYGAARDFFEGAITLRKEQSNAYFGLAIALDGLRDRPGAIGAMRTFVHLSKSDDPYVRKAHAALWEWEATREQAGAAAGQAR